MVRRWAHSLTATIKRAYDEDGVPPAVLSTLTDSTTQKNVADSSAFVFDLFGTFIGSLEAALGYEPSHTPGRMHGIRDAGVYEHRLDALNFTLSHDDGLRTRDLHDATWCSSAYRVVARRRPRFTSACIIRSRPRTIR